jgi:hypothetical protein
LGSPDDPEMERIEALLRAAGEPVVYATVGGRRVTSGEAYKADPVSVPPGAETIIVECGGPALDVCRRCGGRASGEADGLSVEDAGRLGGLGPCGDHHDWPLGPQRGPRRIDHHRPGDPGYGRAPVEFLAASSLGQVIAELARLGKLSAGWEPYPAAYGPPTWRAPVEPPQRWAVRSGDNWFRPPTDLVLAAASDHCPGAAYAGKCPGVEPEALMRWRAETRAAFQGRPVSAILADVEAASAAIKAAPVVDLGEPYLGLIEAADLRGSEVPELPEALLRLGRCALATPRPGPDGRRKVVLMGAGEGTPAGPEPVRAFLGGWAAGNGLVDLYGDPARGFAGGYLP